MIRAGGAFHHRKPRQAPPSPTAKIGLHGNPAADASPGARYAAYGTDGVAVASLERDDPGLIELLDARLPYTRAQVVFAAREEFARTVDDVLHSGQDVLVIKGPDKRVVMVPFVKPLVPEVDVASGFLLIDPPEGLLNLGELT